MGWMESIGTAIQLKSENEMIVQLKTIAKSNSNRKRLQSRIATENDCNMCYKVLK